MIDIKTEEEYIAYCWERAHCERCQLYKIGICSSYILNKNIPEILQQLVAYNRKEKLAKLLEKC